MDEATKAADRHNRLVTWAERNPSGPGIRKQRRRIYDALHERMRAENERARQEESDKWLRK